MLVKSQDGSSMTNVQSAVDVRCRYRLDGNDVICGSMVMGSFDTPERADQIVSEIRTLLLNYKYGYQVPAK
jgi:hypothetical protein